MRVVVRFLRALEGGEGSVARVGVVDGGVWELIVDDTEVVFCLLVVDPKECHLFVVVIVDGIPEVEVEVVVVAEHRVFDGSVVAEEEVIPEVEVEEVIVFVVVVEHHVFDGFVAVVVVATMFV